MTPKPLDGLLVIDLTHFIAGPLCTRLLADLGARVIKVERVYAGDARPSSDAATDSLGKQSICVDLTTAEGQAIVRKLAERADILVQNFRPGVMARWGLAFEDLQGSNPGLILASVSGFGQSGTFASRPAFGATAHAEAGLLWLQQMARGNDSEPFAPGIQVADIVTALCTLSGVLAALHQRTATGRGQHVDISLMDSQLFMLAGPLAEILNPSSDEAWQPFRHPIHRSSDGRHFTINIASEHNWRRLALALGHSEFAGPVPKDGNALIAEWIGALDAAEVVRALDTVGAPYGLVKSLREAVEHPYVRERGMVVEVPDQQGKTTRVVRNPFFFSESDTTPTAGPPLAGQNSHRVLEELGFSDQEIASFEAEGIVRDASAPHISA